MVAKKKTEKSKFDIDVSLVKLLETGAHFGHMSRRWNPKSGRYMHGVRDNVHIFDLIKTKKELVVALTVLNEASKNKATVLFLGTKKNAKVKIMEIAQDLGQPFVSERWLGGTLTNFGQIRKSVRRLKDLKESVKLGEFSDFTKRERLEIDRKIAKLEFKVGGIVSMDSMPDLMVIVDTNREKSAVAEANYSKVPVIGIVDSNADPDLVTYPIPMNDDAAGAVEYVLDLMHEAMGGKVQPKKTKVKKKVNKTEVTAPQAKASRRAGEKNE